MGIAELFQSDFITKTTESFGKIIPTLIVIMILIGIIYWLRELQRRGRTEITVIRGPGK